MLSILIPVYNYNAVDLVKNIHEQASRAEIPFEILLLDDESDNEYKKDNSTLRDLPNTKLFELPTKAGRAIARNYLAVQAQYDYLLFMDCDSEPIDDRFIARYLPYCNKKDVVVCGGTAYKNEKPQANSHLRWHYGMKCETTPAGERRKKPNSKFSTFNFLISRELFLKIRFNELLRNYGHEDTLFGLELLKRNYKVIHINNPLYHTGIDTNRVYLEKTRQGVENLKLLLNLYPNKEELIENIRLLKYYTILEKSRTTGIFSLIFRLFNSLMLVNFNGKNPNLSLFNLYKLGYLCSLKGVNVGEM